jgi:hypothetical protein
MPGTTTCGPLRTWCSRAEFGIESQRSRNHREAVQFAGQEHVADGSKPVESVVANVDRHGRPGRRPEVSTSSVSPILQLRYISPDPGARDRKNLEDFRITDFLQSQHFSLDWEALSIKVGGESRSMKRGRYPEPIGAEGA